MIDPHLLMTILQAHPRWDKLQYFGHQPADGYLMRELVASAPGSFRIEHDDGAWFLVLWVNASESRTWEGKSFAAVVGAALLFSWGPYLSSGEPEE